MNNHNARIFLTSLELLQEATGALRERLVAEISARTPEERAKARVDDLSYNDIVISQFDDALIITAGARNAYTEERDITQEDLDLEWTPNDRTREGQQQ